MNRLFCLFALTFPIIVEQTVSAERPNVLFIIADDLNCDLGCYGHSAAKTPRLDAFAATAVRFNRAYCQVPLCSPSRTCMLTGRTPQATGITLNPGGARFSHEYQRRNDFRDNVPDTVTLPQLFRQNGYFVARVGKLYHYGVPGQIGASGQDDAASWDYVCNPAGRDKEQENEIFSLIPGSYGGTLSWMSQDGGDLEQTDGLGATAALSLLEHGAPGRGVGRGDDHADKPFFLAVGFYRPHTPYVAPHAYFDLHGTGNVELPKLSKDDRRFEPVAAYQSHQAVTLDMSDELRREAIAAYRASVSFVDAQVGRLLDGLEHLGLEDNTIVVFTSDHGYHLYDHNLWQKRSLFEASARVPLMIRAPGSVDPGKATDALAGLIDLYPTLAELCELDAPDYIDGTSLTPVLSDPNAAVNEAVFTQIDFNRGRVGYGVRTDRWRYARWFNGERVAGEILFDMRNDPMESRNLAADDDHSSVNRELWSHIVSELGESLSE